MNKNDYKYAESKSNRNKGIIDLVLLESKKEGGVVLCGSCSKAE
jgi:hypothetical protein